MLTRCVTRAQVWVKNPVLQSRARAKIYPGISVVCVALLAAATCQQQMWLCGGMCARTCVAGTLACSLAPALQQLWAVWLGGGVVLLQQQPVAPGQGMGGLRGLCSRVYA